MKTEHILLGAGAALAAVIGYQFYKRRQVPGNTVASNGTPITATAPQPAIISRVKPLVSDPVIINTASSLVEPVMAAPAPTLQSKTVYVEPEITRSIYPTRVATKELLQLSGFMF